MKTQMTVMVVLALFSGAAGASEISCVASPNQLIANRLMNIKGEESRLVSLKITYDASWSTKDASIEINGWTKDTSRPWTEKVQGTMNKSHWPAGLDLYGGDFRQNKADYFGYGNYATEIDFPDGNVNNNVGRLFFSENHGYPEGTEVPYVEITCVRQ